MTGPEAGRPEGMITDEDVQDVAEWLHPVWFESDYGRSQTYSRLLEAVRGALESRAGAMHDRWEQERIKPPDVLELYNERGQLAEAVMIAASDSYVTTFEWAPRIQRVRFLRGQEPAS